MKPEIPKRWKGISNLILIDGEWMRPAHQGADEYILMAERVCPNGRIALEEIAISIPSGLTAQSFLDGPIQTDAA